MAVLESYSTTSWFFSACLDENKHSENWLKCSATICTQNKHLTLHRLNQILHSFRVCWTCLQMTYIRLRNNPIEQFTPGYPWRFQETPFVQKDPLQNPNNFFLLGWWLNQPIWNILVLDHFLQVGVTKNKKSWKTPPGPSLLNLFWRLESKTKPEQYYNLWANMSICSVISPAGAAAGGKLFELVFVVSLCI